MGKGKLYENQRTFQSWAGNRLNYFRGRSFTTSQTQSKKSRRLNRQRSMPGFCHLCKKQPVLSCMSYLSIGEEIAERAVSQCYLAKMADQDDTDTQLAAEGSGFRHLSICGKRLDVRLVGCKSLSVAEPIVVEAWLARLRAVGCPVMTC